MMSLSPGGSGPSLCMGPACGFRPGCLPLWSERPSASLPGSRKHPSVCRRPVQGRQHDSTAGTRVSAGAPDPWRKYRVPAAPGQRASPSGCSRCRPPGSPASVPEPHGPSHLRQHPDCAGPAGLPHWPLPGWLVSVGLCLASLAWPWRCHLLPRLPLSHSQARQELPRSVGPLPKAVSGA